ncbi:MAG: hypothetical protein AAF847_15830 [Bacteroidota bacterium]
MYQIKIIGFLLIGIVFVACGGDNAAETNDENTINETETIPVSDANSDAAISKMPTASDQEFYGIAVKDSIATHADKLIKTTIQNGEGTFEVYEIKDADGMILGQLYADPLNQAFVGDIVITSPEVVTDEGVKIGMTFTELKNKFNQYEVHGSEIESRVSFVQANHAYRLDYPSNQYDLDESEIPSDAKVIEIKIVRHANR